jgi:hypothetical protein
MLGSLAEANEEVRHSSCEPAVLATVSLYRRAICTLIVHSSCRNAAHQLSSSSFAIIILFILSNIFPIALPSLEQLEVSRLLCQVFLCQRRETCGVFLRNCVQYIRWIQFSFHFAPLDCIPLQVFDVVSALSSWAQSLEHHALVQGHFYWQLLDRVNERAVDILYFFALAPFDGFCLMAP